MLALAAYLPYLAAGAQNWAASQTCVLSAQETLPGPVILNPDKSGNTSLNVSASPEPSAVTCSDGTTLWSNSDEVLAVAYEAVRGDEALVAAGTVEPAPQAALHYFAQQKDFAPVGTSQLDVGRADAGIGLVVDYLAQVADLDGDGRWTDVDKVVAWHPMSKQTWQDASGNANATAFWSKQLVTADGNYSWAVAGPRSVGHDGEGTVEAPAELAVASFPFVNYPTPTFLGISACMLVPGVPDGALTVAEAGVTHTPLVGERIGVWWDGPAVMGGRPARVKGTVRNTDLQAPVPNGNSTTFFHGSEILSHHLRVRLLLDVPATEPVPVRYSLRMTFGRPIPGHHMQWPLLLSYCALGLGVLLGSLTAGVCAHRYRMSGARLITRLKQAHLQVELLGQSIETGSTCTS